MLNFGIAQDFPGSCNLRFDDTNPAKEEEEFVEAIKEDVAWLGYAWSELRFASDYFEQLYQFAIELIESGKAFVCDLTPEQVREYRGTLTEPGTESPFRGRPAEESLDLLERMKIYAAELPKQARWQVDLVNEDLARGEGGGRGTSSTRTFATDYDGRGASCLCPL